ncbi:MAG: HAD-IA family hydrolase [Idiomarina sp.]|nr:HAD-IA family hydrolase [Idiomarina sp.]
MTWQFHRRLQPIDILSFDLDDTLYANAPVMVRAEQEVADFIATRWPQSSELDVRAWRQLRDQVAAANAELASDMTALRLATLEQGLSACGVASARDAAEEAMAEFLIARNRVDISPEVHQLLRDLASRYRLIAVSNGNADIQRIGLSDYFEAAFQPGNGRRGKPYSDLFDAAAARLTVKNSSRILHIGDHPVSDVQGALKFGAQALWYAPEAQTSSSELTWLPHATITDLQALRALL